MAKFISGMNVSLDGYVDHEAFAPGILLFRHWIGIVRDLTASVYGRRLYEVMRYWDADDPAWSPDHRAFAEAWRKLPKWVVSGTLTSVGPNATLISNDIEANLRRLKTDLAGEVSVGGTLLAHYAGDIGLIDEYQLYFRPVVLGGGKPFFAGPRPPLRFVSSELIGEDAMRLRYVPN